jgi:hypothetical protein
MKFIRPMPQRALQAPNRSEKVNSAETRGTFPTGVSNHSWKPGTLSVIAPPPAEVGGPQQGGLSRPSPEETPQSGELATP